MGAGDGAERIRSSDTGLEIPVYGVVLEIFARDVGAGGSSFFTHDQLRRVVTTGSSSETFWYEGGDRDPHCMLVALHVAPLDFTRY